MPKNSDGISTSSTLQMTAGLQQNTSAGAALCMWYFGVEAAVICLERIAANCFGKLFSTVGVAFLLVLFLLPMQLGIKGWFLTSSSEATPLRKAFFSFERVKHWRHAAWFCLVQSVSLLGGLLLLWLPTLLMVGILRAAARSSGGAEGAVYGALLVLSGVSALLAVFFGGYFAMGFFPMDYLFWQGSDHNPFRAMADSFRMMRGERHGLCRRIGSQLPWYLLSLTVVGLPFALPKVKRNYAVYVAERMKINRKG